MKKILIPIFTVVALALPSACTREMPVDTMRENTQAEDGEFVTIYASMEQTLTKTSLDAADAVVWNANDQIRVYNAANPEGKVFTLQEASAGQVQGAFIGESLTGTGPYYAVYPATAGGTLTGGSVQINLSSVQNGTAAGTFAPGANVAVGMAAGISEIYFRNVCGLLGVTLQGDASISKVCVIADGGEFLSGTGVVEVTSSGNPFMVWTGDGSSSVELAFASPVALSGGKTFYLVVPAGSLSGGFSVEVQDAAGGAMVRHASAGGANVVPRSSIRPMPALAYTAEHSAAWLGAEAAGISKNVQPGKAPVPIVSWDEETGQCAWGGSGESGISFRIQDWDAGYAVSVTLAAGDYVVGDSYPATVKVLGNVPAMASMEGLTMKVVKKAGGMLWLSDGTQGYVMKTNED